MTKHIFFHCHCYSLIVHEVISIAEVYATAMLYTTTYKQMTRGRCSIYRGIYSETMTCVACKDKEKQHAFIEAKQFGELCSPQIKLHLDFINVIGHHSWFPADEGTQQLRDECTCPNNFGQVQ